jgi:hypothetical protein
MTQDTRAGERRLSALRAVVAIFLGMLVAILSAIRGDDTWVPIVLVGACLAVGAGLLVYASRR